MICTKLSTNTKKNREVFESQAVVLNDPGTGRALEIAGPVVLLALSERARGLRSITGGAVAMTSERVVRYCFTM